MCLAVCNKKMGGCGHIGDDKEWLRKESSFHCPVCGYDSMYFLYDYNLEVVVEGSMVEDAKSMLNDYYISLRGQSVRHA